MEFPDTGKRCSVCKQLDFLPVVCKFCQVTLCKIHFHARSHQCPKYDDNVTSVRTKSTNFPCSNASCKETSPIEMQCIKCKRHFCFQHRYHGCLELTNGEKQTKLKVWQISKKQFADAKAVVDQQVSESLKKTKNLAMANKVRLMRVKGSASGPKNVPIDSRCYFQVHPPTTITNKHIGPTKGIYVNVNWTIGKAIDAMADILHISNNNNIPDACKLQLFHQSTGTLICNEMDTPLAKLYENSEIIDGQDVILEYSNDTCIDASLYK